MSKVIIAKQPGAIDLIFSKLNLAQALENRETIFIKVNLRAAAVRDYTPCAITNINVIEQLVAKLLLLNKKIILAEGTSSKIMTAKAIDNSGINKLARQNVQIINLNKTKTRRLDLPQTKLKYIDVYEVVLNSDYIISLPVMKTHIATLVSLAMKNMMGITSELTLPRLHLNDIDESIVKLNQAVKIDLSIVDATKAMEGTGPVLGSEVFLNSLVAGFDTVAVDSVCSQMMGFHKKEIKQLLVAQNIKLGNIDPEIIGHLTPRPFRRPSHSLAKDMYSYQWFNWLMSKKFIHAFVYDYAYFFIKRALNLVRKKDCH